MNIFDRQTVLLLLDARVGCVEIKAARHITDALKQSMHGAPAILDILVHAPCRLQKRLLDIVAAADANKQKREKRPSFRLRFCAGLDVYEPVVLGKCLGLGRGDVTLGIKITLVANQHNNLRRVMP